MITHYTIKSLTVILLLLTAVTSKANLLNLSPNAGAVIPERIIQQSEQTSYGNNRLLTQTTKSDSLPPGFTNEIMKNLRDEYGNKIIEDEGDALQQKLFNGFASGDEYGQSVSTAGDVNGDGYDDIIIGAQKNDAGGTNAGRAYIYFGGIIINNAVDVILTGEAAGISFGTSVSEAGDVNGDGYSDVIVGAPFYNSNTGRAYIFYGGSFMNSVADVTLTGEATGNLFGTSVSTAGNVNGDGYSDVIVGAYGNNSSTGRAYVYFGGSSMNNGVDVTLTGETAGDQFGWSVSNAGDVNGDGFSDVIAGAFAYSSFSGKAYIFFGGSSMNNTADVTMADPEPGNLFGISVSTAGDVNGDGYSDVIIGANGHNSATGRAYIFYGGFSMDNFEDVTLNGDATFSLFGTSVSPAGDINGDGYSDVIVGGYQYNTYTGRTFVFFGGIVMNDVVDFKLTGEAANSNFGWSVSTAGDINGDGYSDFIVAADGFASNSGRVYVYTNAMTGEDLSDLSLPGITAGSWFGFSVATAGDVNGDGYSDVIVGAHQYSTNTGRAYLFYGGSSMDNVADVIMTGEGTGNVFGVSVSSAGDVNGDGYSDVIVGAYGYSTSTGRVYVFYGGASMNNVADVTMTGQATINSFGYSVSDAGDVNGDGYSDVIVGAYGYSSSTGRAYVFYGGASMNNTADVTMTGEASSNWFGRSVSTAGDVNGDGFSDVIVGAPLNVKAYVFYGSSSMNNVADLVMAGDLSASQFGESVSDAGDVNGDGYSDVIIGHQGYNSNTGQAYIFYGGLLMNNTVDVTMTGEAQSDFFGVSVSAAGDVNADGYADVIVGSQNYNVNVGRAYIFFGHPSMDNIADVTMTGEAASSLFGRSASTAGDVNRDGYSDVIVGAYGYSSNTGRAYIYVSSAPNVNPGLLSVKDIPADQGGYVKLKWAKSGLDIPVNGTVSEYIVERSLPPGAIGYQWEQIGTVLPTQSNTYYYYTASTPADSSINGNSTFFFRVSAYTSVALEIYRSNILSGYSVDNLSPLPPQNLTGAFVMNAAELDWNANTETDLKHYIIYRSGLQIGISMTQDFTDNMIVQDSTYSYKIAAEDIHGNIGGFSNTVIITYNVSTINIKVIPEGFYNTSSEKLNAKDTVRAYLHNNTSPFNVLDSAITRIDSVTFTGSFKFLNAQNGTYYIVIKHRNTIETWSRTGGETFTEGTIMSYNFTDAVEKAFGNNLKQVDNSPLRFALFSGDVSRDGSVDVTDVVNVFNDANNFVSGYVTTDVTGDDFVDAADLIITFNNSNNFVSVIKP